MSQTKIVIYELLAKNTYSKMNILETNISLKGIFFFFLDLSLLGYEGTGLLKGAGPSCTW